MLVDHAVVGIAPALIAQAAGTARAIVEQPVPVVVSVLGDPGQRVFDGVSQLVEQREVARPVGVFGEQAEEQRCRVDRAVVAGERRRVDRRHLSQAQLVDDLAGLFLVHRIDAAAEPAGEHPERLLRHLRRPGDHLQRGDQAVATEQRGEPRNAGGVVRLAVEPRAQHPEIEQ